jgi:hypothetical protein
MDPMCPGNGTESQPDMMRSRSRFIKYSAITSRICGARRMLGLLFQSGYVDLLKIEIQQRARSVL